MRLRMILAFATTLGLFAQVAALATTPAPNRYHGSLRTKASSLAAVAATRLHARNSL